LFQQFYPILEESSDKSLDRMMMHVDDNHEKEEKEGDFSSSFPTIPREYLEDFNSHNNHSYGTMIATATVTEESLVVIVPPVLAKYNQQEKHMDGNDDDGDDEITTTNEYNTTLTAITTTTGLTAATLDDCEDDDDDDGQREQQVAKEKEREDIYGLRTSYATVSYWDTPTTTTTNDSAGSLAIIPSSSSSPRTTTIKNKYNPNRNSLKSSSLTQKQLDLFCYQSIDRNRSTNTSLSTTTTTWNNYSDDTLCSLDNNAVVAAMMINNTKPKTMNSRQRSQPYSNNSNDQDGCKTCRLDKIRNHPHCPRNSSNKKKKSNISMMSSPLCVEY